MSPKQTRTRRVASERVSSRDAIARRLQMLGASDEEVQGVLDGWDRMDADWTEDARYAMTHLSDARLKEALQQVRAEYPYEEERRGELLEGAPDAVAMGAFDRADTPPALLPEGAPIIAAPIAALDEWVGDDKERARLVIDAETLDCQLRAQTPRKTLIAKMNAVIDE